MRIAVIDSGVNLRHPHILGVAGGVSIAAGGIEEGSFLDALGHGTAVMAAIQEKYPEGEYFAVRIFHSALKTTAACLERSIEWSISAGMDVVNMSLGTRNAAHAELLGPVVERARAAGIALVSAAECYPGCLPGAFAVGLDEGCERDAYRFDEKSGVFYASGYPRPAPGIPRERNLQGISFAVANMSGFVARERARLGRAPAGTLRRALAVNSTPFNNERGP